LEISEKILLSYITLRGYDLESIYHVVKDSNGCTFEDLVDKFSVGNPDNNEIPTGQIRDCISFLVNVNVIRASENKNEYSLTQDFKEVPFKLVLLNKFRIDKSNAFSAVLSHLISLDVMQFDISEFQHSVEKGLDLGFTWTPEKLDFWMDLADYLSLGRKYVGKHSFALYPSPKLLFSILKDCLSYENSKLETITLGNFLDYCSTHYFPILTRERLLFKGLQQSILQLNKIGEVQLRPAASDDPHGVLLNGKLFGHISLEAQTI
jgi:hypothetical protein